ncbi:hypothetical protein ACP8Y2_01115 [Herpetosiphon llansteffanensis]
MLRRLLWIGILLLLIGCQHRPLFECFRPVVSTPTTKLAMGQRLVMLDRILAIEPAPIKPITLEFSPVHDRLTTFRFNFERQNNHVNFADLERFFQITPPESIVCDDTLQPQHYSFVLEVISNTKSYTQPFEVAYKADVNDFDFYNVDPAEIYNKNYSILLIIILGTFILITLVIKVFILIVVDELYKETSVRIATIIAMILILGIFNFDFYQNNQELIPYCYSIKGHYNQKYLPIGKGTVMLPNGIQSQETDLKFYPLHDLDQVGGSLDNRTSYRYYFEKMPELESMPKYPNCDVAFDFIYTDMYLVKQNNTISSIPITFKPEHKWYLDWKIESIKKYNISRSILTSVMLLTVIMLFIRSKRPKAI